MMFLSLHDEVRFASQKIPPGWIFTTLESISEITLGQSPPSHTYNKDKKGLPFYQGKLDFGDVYPAARTWCTSPKKIAEKDDILISVRAPVGPTNICPDRSCIGRGLAAIRSLGGIQSLFILYLLRSYENEIKQQSTGTTFGAIIGPKLKQLRILLPPLNEQHRIVSKLEELFTNLDAGLEYLKRTQILLNQYRQSVLKYAFEGKFTKMWREKNRSNIPLLPFIEINQLKKQKNKKINGDSESQDDPLLQIPRDWQWVKLSDLYSAIMGQSPPGNSYNTDGKGMPLLNGPTEFGQYCPTPVQWTTQTTKTSEKGDLLICVRGNTTGRLNWSDQRYCIGRGLATIRPKIPSMNIQLLFFFLLMKTKELYSLSTGSTFPNLTGNKLNEFPFPLIPPNEQLYIVNIVERLFSVIDNNEKIINQNLVYSVKMRNSILKSAFEGKLVSQDPKDEPAEILLERIRRQRVSINPAVKGNSKIAKKENHGDIKQMRLI